jgi:hypothetical protein
LKALPQGVHTLGAESFDVRGMIQLSGEELRTYGQHWPHYLRDIPVHRWVKRIHFLQGAVSEVVDGRKIGFYTVHYASGRTQEVSIVYGRDLRALWQPSDSSGTVSNAVVAWSGRNPSASERGMLLRLYRKSWENPRPEDEIRSLRV